VIGLRWVWNLGEEMTLPVGRQGMEIRILPVRGVSVAAGIMAQTWQGYVTRDEAAAFLRKAQDQGRLYPFVAYLEGHPAGSALVVVRGRSAQLYGGVHVLPEYRRGGVGSAILRAVLRHLKTLGLTHLYVAREVSDPPTEDDLAAQALYHRGGGVRQKPLIEVVYSPQCPWCASWLDGFREEVAGRDVEFRDYNLFDAGEGDRAWRLLESHGLARAGAQGPVLLENVFTRVFVDGEAVGGGVPIPRGLLAASAETALGDEASRLGRRASGAVPEAEAGARASAAAGTGIGTRAQVPAAGESGPDDSGGSAPYPRMLPAVAAYPSSLTGLKLERLDAADPSRNLGMCLGRHPSGFAPEPGAGERGGSLKRHWLGSLDLPEGFFGVAASREESVVGILEVYPRRIAARAGYVTGTWGESDKILTMTCLEVARDEARQPVMEFLLEGLLKELAGSKHGFEHVEAVGIYGNLAGFNPYWLFDKYGFTRREERVPGKSVIMSRALG